MKAAVCREFGAPLTIEEVRLDPPQAGEVTVRIAACAVCHSDITYMQGGWGGSLPAVYGHEAAGVVEAVGPGVGGLRPGDHVVVTLIRSCGSCHYCAQGKPVLCETSFRLDEQGPIHGRGWSGDPSGDADRRVRGAGDRPRLADGRDPRRYRPGRRFAARLRRHHRARRRVQHRAGAGWRRCRGGRHGRGRAQQRPGCCPVRCPLGGGARSVRQQARRRAPRSAPRTRSTRAGTT